MRTPLDNKTEGTFPAPHDAYYCTEESMFISSST